MNRLFKKEKREKVTKDVEITPKMERATSPQHIVKKKIGSSCAGDKSTLQSLKSLTISVSI
jgi:hypothetical protein